MGRLSRGGYPVGGSYGRFLGQCASRTLEVEPRLEVDAGKTAFRIRRFIRDAVVVHVT
jgi:hypothetical protein